MNPSYLALEAGHELSYRVVKALVVPLLKRRIRLRAEGLANLPRTGAGLVVSNHRCILDPFLMGAVTGRHIHFVASSWMGRVPGWRELMESLGILILPPRNRSEMLVELARRQFAAGALLGIFPEGEWPTLGPPAPDQLAPFHMGVARLVLEAGGRDLPTIPAAFVGKGEYVAARVPAAPFRRMDPGNPLFLRDTLDLMVYREVTVRFGKPLIFVSKRPLDEEALTAAEAKVVRVLQDAVQGLLVEA